MTNRAIDRNQISKVLKLLRESSASSIANISSFTGLKYATIIKMESRNYNNNASHRVIDIYANHFDLPVSLIYLLAEVGCDIPDFNLHLANIKAGNSGDFIRFIEEKNEGKDND